MGLVGSNGIGKSTALKILSGKLKPNLGRYDNPPDWQDVIKYFRGSELQSSSAQSATSHFQRLMRSTDYFTKILEDDLKAIVKPQYVDRIPKAIKGPDKTVRTLIEANASMENLEEVLDVLGMMRPPGISAGLMANNAFYRTESHHGSRCESSFWRRASKICHRYCLRAAS